VAQNGKRKRTPSDFEKKIRFFTILGVIVVLLLFGGLLWLVNYETYRAH
jgi:hypothetical protein